MFKVGILALSLMFSSLCFAEPVQARSDIESDVMASFDSLVQASKALDVEQYLHHIDVDKFVGLNSDGTNWNSIYDFAPLITQGFPAISSITALEFPSVTISVIDQRTAVLVNEFVQTMRLKNGSVLTICGGGTQVWSRQQEKWKLVSISASNKPDSCKE